MTYEFYDFDIFPHHIPTTMNQENRPFLTIKEVSNLLGISVSTINRLIKIGDFPKKFKLSPRRMVFMKREIDEWIESKRSE